MPVDENTGLYYEWMVDERGETHRDFRMSVDDRFQEDPATGEWVKVREKASGQRYDDPPDDWPEGSGAKTVEPLAHWIGDEPPDDVRKLQIKIAKRKTLLSQGRRR